MKTINTGLKIKLIFTGKEWICDLFLQRLSCKTTENNIAKLKIPEVFEKKSFQKSY